MRNVKIIKTTFNNYWIDRFDINLIIYNPNDKDTFEKPDKADIQKFKYILEQSGKKVTIRLERGSDIDAACGQLSNKYK